MYSVKGSVFMKKVVLVLSALCVLMLSACSADNMFTLWDKNNEVSSEKESDYILPSDNTVITEIDLSKLNETELRYAYAEVFARHGKAFEDKNWSKYFNSKDWYVPNPSYRDSDLSEIEVENANYIKEYINLHFETTTQPTTQTKSGNTVVVVHDEPYYFNNTWGDGSFIIPDSSVRRLTKSELYGYDSNTLALIRNEIYARNGYVFQKEKYKSYFGSKTWYTPNSSFNESWLNSIEKYNVQLIKSME